MTTLLPTSVKPEVNAKFPVLISYAYLREETPERQAHILSNPHVELLLDSGAFSALNAGKVIVLDEYMDFLNTWKDKLYGYIALDVLGDSAATDNNLQTMLSNGLTPVPVHVWGDDEARMDELYSYSSWVALGGLRRPQRGWCSPAYVKQKMIWAKGRDVHWLGYTRADMLRGFKPFSCDSANAFSGGMYGLAMLFHRDCGGKMAQPKWHEAVKKPTPRAAKKLLQACGMPVEWFKIKDRWRSLKARYGGAGSIPNMLGAGAMVEYSRWLREQTGTRYFLAVNCQENYDVLQWWINNTIAEGEIPYNDVPVSKFAKLPTYQRERQTLIDPIYKDIM